MKQSKFLLLAMCVLLLAGCSLARAEAEMEIEDRWVGFYVVPSKSGGREFYSNPNLEEYGSDSIDTGEFGTFSVAREVLFAVEDEAGNYTFPGIETGFSLFCVDTEEEFGHVNKIVSNMGGHDGGNAITYTDEGSSRTLSGTVYCGPPLGVTDWDPYQDGTIWNFFRVYQTEDGRVYLNGHSDSTNGPMTHTLTQTYTHRTNGEIDQEETVTVTVAVTEVSRMDRLVVTQFDADHNVLRSEDLSLQDDRTEVYCVDNAAWLLVEETGPDGTERTVYSVPEGEDPVTHDYVLLDDDGYGYLAYLNIYSK